jgi:hypothetical protein
MFCNKSFKKWNATKTTKHKSVPWWTGELKLMRRRINALRRRYQRTTNYNGHKQKCKNQYNGGKLQYQAAIKREKFKSWKEFWNLNSATNPWNAVYKLASNKANRSQSLTTLQKPDVSLTTDINGTITYMLDYLIPKDEVDYESEYHNTIRTQTERSIHTAVDRE